MKYLTLSCMLACLLLNGCGKNDPFDYVPVTGKLTYEDGTLLPVAVQLTFYPIGGSVNIKTNARPGMVTTEKATGEFRDVTSHRYGDGLVRGRHRVTLGGGNGRPLPDSVAAAEYGDPDHTPLEVDTSKLPFEIKVKKPR
jgi:hypothetical protein